MSLAPIGISVKQKDDELNGTRRDHARGNRSFVPESVPAANRCYTFRGGRTSHLSSMFTTDSTMPPPNAAQKF
jgi:hypothetical protein